MPPRTKRERKNLELTENIASLARLMSIFSPLYSRKIIGLKLEILFRK